jgi:MFS family permease
MEVVGATIHAMPGGAGTIGEAFHYLAGKPRLALLLVMVAVIAFTGWPMLALLPALAQHHLELGGLIPRLFPYLADRPLEAEKIGYGLLLSGIGLGALLAALTIASFGSLSRSRRFIGTGVVLTAAALVALSWAESLPLAVASCVGVGYGLILFMATSQAVIQLGAGDHNRGRIMGIYSMVLSGAQPLGNLLFGPAADSLGEPVVLRFEGLGLGLGALGVLALLVVWTCRRRARSSPDLSG